MDKSTERKELCDWITDELFPSWYSDEKYSMETLRKVKKMMEEERIKKCQINV